MNSPTSRKIRRELARATAPVPQIVTLTRGGKIEVRRGSKGEKLLRKAGWREAS